MKVTKNHLRFYSQKKTGQPTWANGFEDRPVSIHSLIPDRREMPDDYYEVLESIRKARSQGPVQLTLALVDVIGESPTSGNVQWYQTYAHSGIWTARQNRMASNCQKWLKRLVAA